MNKRLHNSAAGMRQLRMLSQAQRELQADGSSTLSLIKKDVWGNTGQSQGGQTLLPRFSSGEVSINTPPLNHPGCFLHRTVLGLLAGPIESEPGQGHEFAFLISSRSVSCVHSSFKTPIALYKHGLFHFDHLYCNLGSPSRSLLKLVFFLLFFFFKALRKKKAHHFGDSSQLERTEKWVK